MARFRNVLFGTLFLVKLMAGYLKFLKNAEYLKIRKMAD
jgi:hypothetical protein